MLYLMRKMTGGDIDGVYLNNFVFLSDGSPLRDHNGMHGQRPEDGDPPYKRRPPHPGKYDVRSIVGIPITDIQ